MTRPARIDAIDKVLGRTVFVDDLRTEGAPLVALVVTSRIAKGRVGRIGTDAALAVHGVVQIMTHINAPRLRRILAASMAEIGSIRPLQDDRIRYHGQAVAVVIAKDWQAAHEAAECLDVEEIADTKPVVARLAGRCGRPSGHRSAGRDRAGAVAKGQGVARLCAVHPYRRSAFSLRPAPSQHHRAKCGDRPLG